MILSVEAHLMIAEPDRYLEAFAAGIDGLTVHVEGVIHLHRTLGDREAGQARGRRTQPGGPHHAWTRCSPISISSS